MPSAKSAPRTKAPEPAARPLLARARALSAFGGPFTSEQHFGAAGTSELHLDEAGRDAYAASETLPTDSELALVWIPRGGRANEASVLWMTKTGAGFRYALERPDGTSGTPEELARCARCHAEAPSDELFRVLPPSASETAAAK